MSLRRKISYHHSKVDLGKDVILWTIICLDSEIRKAHVNKEVLVGVFFDIEKAYDMMWKEGLLIKLQWKLKEEYIVGSGISCSIGLYK